MPAYVIFVREEPIRDQAAMDKYRNMGSGSAGNFKIKPLAAYGKMETIEGKAADGIVLLEFPTMDEARAWYNSPAYQAAVPHRRKGAEYRAFIVEGM